MYYSTLYCRGHRWGPLPEQTGQQYLQQTESAALILAILIIYILFDLILETTKDILWPNSHSIIYLGE